MLIRRLTPADAAAFQALRLTALQESPTAFSSSHEEEVSMPLSVISAALQLDSGRPKFGAFASDVLIGMVGVGRATARKQVHKGYIWGVYVHPAQRGKGAGKLLLAAALDYLNALPDMGQVLLSVTAGNANATSLYETMGFSVYGTEPAALCVAGPYYDELLMVRPVHRS